MLVLSRKRNEVIRIGPSIFVQIVEIRGDKVRLGIIAPKQIEVHRDEVWELAHPPEKPYEPLGRRDQGEGEGCGFCPHCGSTASRAIAPLEVRAKQHLNGRGPVQQGTAVVADEGEGADNQGPVQA